MDATEPFSSLIGMDATICSSGMNVQQEANTYRSMATSAVRHHSSSFDLYTCERFNSPGQATSSSIGVILNNQVCGCEKISRLPFSRIGMRNVVLVLSTLALQLRRSCSVDSIDTPVSLSACVRIPAEAFAGWKVRTPDSLSSSPRRSIRSKPCSYIVKGVPRLNTIKTHRLPIFRPLSTRSSH